MRKNIVAGNWKMNLDMNESHLLVQNILDNPIVGEIEIIIAPAFIHLNKIKELVSNTNIHVAAQDCSANNMGAFTGEVSAKMISSYNIDYVIIGHSERRFNFNESNALLLTKINQALKNKLNIIFCCGENIDHRQKGSYFELIEKQLSETVFQLSSNEISNITIAYEPIWAIGTGQTASVDQAQEIHRFIRNLFERKYGFKISNNISILYGGSCNASNSQDLFSCEDVDGGLIGGASLKSDDFVKIINSF